MLSLEDRGRPPHAAKPDWRLRKENAADINGAVYYMCGLRERYAIAKLGTSERVEKYLWKTRQITL
jgi:hypothetical protein